MNQVKSILQKIELSLSSESSISNIEKDLLLQHTRNLYEAILNLQTTVEPFAIPNKEIMEVEQVQPEESAPTIMPESENEGSTIPPLELETYTEEEIEKPQFNAFEEAPKSIVVDFEEEDEIEEDLIEEESESESIEHQIISEDVDFENDENVDFEVEENEHLSPASEIEKRQENLFLEETISDKPIPHEAHSSTDFKVWNRDIRSYIGINDKYNFISELFGNNPEAYDEILNELNLCENKNEALQFLENSGITTLYQWKEDGFSEQIFYNVLSQFFSSK